ncbi:MAG: hypothetical protein QY309_03245 [Cyclobacteriaceae bacterium]|nr:MAG: hypothetical protein QY309_03245 [Cyclobacteriaceae bacterium]
MPNLFSYIVKHDSGAAPNPFWGVCTLTICKPTIRRTAKVGDWIIGTGSKNARLKDGKVHDLSGCIVYAMKVTAIQSMAEYDAYCQKRLKKKMPNWFSKDWRRIIGDCIYDYSGGPEPKLRRGVHTEENRRRDLSGQHALLSTHFYYFGEEPRAIPKELKAIVKKSQGHLKIENPELINAFLKWIKKFKKNKLYADPQLRWKFGRVSTEDVIMECSKEHLKEDKRDIEKVIC